jgi:MFS family permease
MIIYVVSWIPLAFFAGSIPPNMFYPLLFVMGFFCGAYVPNYAHIADGQPTSFMATSNGMLNIWYFIGGAGYQALMGVVLDMYGKVDGKFPVEAYQATFMFCMVSLVAGAVAMYFTTDSKPIITKKAA